ncbi:MAG: fasciclin domain-containing protein [Desulfuromonadales bacterium]|nr:fasciclin domain-containing protein [Desulfuromonadales bacterium]
MKDLYETLISDGTFTKLLDLLDKAGLSDKLRNPGTITLFAPDDKAFTRLDIDEVTKERDKLVALAGYHFVEGRLTAADISREETLMTECGKSLTILTEDTVQVIDNAKYVAADIECSNGIIHVIDNVFLPQVSGWYCPCC